MNWNEEGHIVIHRVDGSVLLETSYVNPRDALRALHDSGLDLSGLDLSGWRVRYEHIPGWTITDGNLSGLNLEYGSLDRCKLHNCSMRGARLRGCIVQGAIIVSPDVIDAGTDSRGWRFLGVRAKPNRQLSTYGWSVVAGCRELNPDKALQHWGGQTHRGSRALGVECLSKVLHIQKVAEARGWEMFLQPDPSVDVAA